MAPSGGRSTVGSVAAGRFAEEEAAGRVRPEWTWFAGNGSGIVARALWWGRADSERPLALDCPHVLPEVSGRAADALDHAGDEWAGRVSS